MGAGVAGRQQVDLVVCLQGDGAIRQACGNIAALDSEVAVLTRAAGVQCDIACGLQVAAHTAAAGAGLLAAALLGTDADVDAEAGGSTGVFGNRGYVAGCVDCAHRRSSSAQGLNTGVAGVANCLDDLGGLLGTLQCIEHSIADAYGDAASAEFAFIGTGAGFSHLGDVDRLCCVSVYLKSVSFATLTCH